MFLSPADASAVSPDYLLSDRDLTDSDAMNLAQIQRFLSEKGTLAYYYAEDTDSVVKTAAEIIYRVAKTYLISPKFLLALIQREQSLIEDKRPTPSQYDWATGFGVCDACSKSDPNLQDWKGFSRQVEGAAKQIRNRYLPDLDSKGTTLSGIGPGIQKIIDGVPIAPKNKATAILYTYTPHLNGNLNFAAIWKKWFSLSYPDASLVKAPNNKNIWLIQNGQRRLFTSRSVFLSRFREKDIIPIKTEDLEQYPLGPEIKFANWSLIKTPDEKIYLIDGDSKRMIESDKVFRRLGFNPDELEAAAIEDLGGYADGSPITLSSAHPAGTLIQDKKTGGVYWVQDGSKYPIWSKELLQARFANKIITPGAPEQLNSLPTGDPVRFKDGTLIGIKGQPTVYVVEFGRRRPIMSEKVFVTYGWKWQNVVWTSDAVAGLHEPGEPMDILEETVRAASE